MLSLENDLWVAMAHMGDVVAAVQILDSISIIQILSFSPHNVQWLVK